MAITPAQLPMGYGHTTSNPSNSPWWLMTLPSAYTDKKDAEHLMSALWEHYQVTEDWTATQYCGITLAWDYTARTVDLSMPGYID